MYVYIYSKTISTLMTTAYTMISFPYSFCSIYFTWYKSVFIFVFLFFLIFVFFYYFKFTVHCCLYTVREDTRLYTYMLYIQNVICAEFECLASQILVVCRYFINTVVWKISSSKHWIERLKRAWTCWCCWFVRILLDHCSNRLLFCVTLRLTESHTEDDPIS